MQKVILIFALLVVVGFATPRVEDLKALWEAWKSVHSKTYTDGEDAARFGIFVDNYNYITKFNAENSNTKLGLNIFADLTATEFKAMKSGCAFEELNTEFVKKNTIRSGRAAYPTSVDWRTKGVVTPVKNQGQCGSCWTFSTTGVLESYHAISTGTLLSLSEQQIVDCATSAGYGCEGGWPYLAVEYAAEQGLELESDYPYTAEDGKCKYDASKAVKVNTGYTFVGTDSVDDLKTAIATMPVSILIEADQNVFQLYTKGIISTGCGASLDHAVLAVGYESGAFIVKNSWGTSWGDQGYVYISDNGSANAGAGVCGILSQPLIPK